MTEKDRVSEISVEVFGLSKKFLRTWKTAGDVWEFLFQRVFFIVAIYRLQIYLIQEFYTEKLPMKELRLSSGIWAARSDVVSSTNSVEVRFSIHVNVL